MRENTGKKEAERIGRLFSNHPVLPKELWAKQDGLDVTVALGAGIDEIRDQSEYRELRLRGGLLAYTADGQIGYAANHMANKQSVSAMRKMEAEDLRKKYWDIWGQRSAAKRIADEAGLSVRTVQKYIKEFPHPKVEFDPFLDQNERQ